ncbi:YdcF family protein [Massilia timonae]|uniref:YdcF family protein n=1 Tax=Massilia timonae TaxID=47229 RepID=UPI0028D78505|nr:YdcF family protein [Massilia timonae]
MPPDLSAIAAYVMPELPLRACDVGLLFGTRHGVEEFCLAAHDLWQRSMFRVLLVSGGVTRGDARPEAEVIGARLVELGMPPAALVLETAATNTGQNVVLGRAALAAQLDLASVRSVLAIGKACAMRRYLMTLECH